MYDFSKDRAGGDTFGFVKNYVGLDDKETFKRFADNFGTSGQPQTKSIYNVWQNLNPISDIQKEYLVKRAITPSKICDFVKNYGGGLGCLVYENSVAK